MKKYDLYNLGSYEKNHKKSKDDRISKYLRERAIKEKKSISFVPGKTSLHNLTDISQQKYINKIKARIESDVPTPLLESWKCEILNLIPLYLKNGHRETCNNIMKECEEEWTLCLRKLSVKRIIKCDEKSEIIFLLNKSNKLTGYKQYFKNKKILEEKLFIGHPLMQSIIKFFVDLFPNYLVNFTDYRKETYVNIDDLTLIFHDDLKKSEETINIWYKKIIYHINTSKSLKKSKKKDNLLFCASKLMNILMAGLKLKTIEMIIETVNHVNKIPLIEMKLDFEKSIILHPSFDNIYSTYLNFLYSIDSLCLSLENFQSIVNIERSSKFILKALNTEILNNCSKKLKCNLENTFSSILCYVSHLKVDFKELCENENADFLIEQIEIQPYEKIKKYNEIIGKLSLMLNNEYFNIGKISQIDMINKLKDYCYCLRDGIISNLSLIHKNGCHNICEQFQNIVDKVTKTPNDAAELIALDKFCLNVKEVEIEELKNKIYLLISTMIKLVEMTSLSTEHIKINSEMMNWPMVILDILDKSMVNFENYKYDIEEVLIAKNNVLNKKIIDLIPYMEILDEMDDINNTRAYLEDIRRLVHWINDCDEELSKINKEETIFKFPISQYSELDDLKKHIFPFYELMYLLHKWRRSYYTWMDGPFEYINNSVVETEHDYYFKEFSKILKDYKNKIKQQIADKNDRRFKGLVEDPDPMNLPAPMKLCTQALNELKNWRPWVQLVNIVCNPALKNRHWNEMSRISGHDLIPNAGTSIRKLINLNVWENMHEYDIISTSATKELNLITNLETMLLEWESVKFEFGHYKDTNIEILIRLDNIQAVLDDHLVKTLGMRGSSFVRPVENDVKAWYEKLIRINKSIEEWSKVQARYLYFLPLFSSKNIQNQMATENILFQDVDKIHNNFLQISIQNPKVVDIAGGFELLDEMKKANGMLEKINEGVNNYVNKKTLHFPRFFFLSMDEILEILSETSNPNKVQPHLKKCFEGINHLNFDSEFNILSMISKETEEVTFLKPISTAAAEGSVEKWLLEVEYAMINVIKYKIECSHCEYSTLPYENWLEKGEGMIILCVSQIYWTANVHQHIKLGKLKILLITLEKKLNNLVYLIRSPSLSNKFRMSLKALIVIEVHAKDVVQELINKGVKDDCDFPWLSQLRYYWENNNVIVRIINASVRYGYEYLGNSDRLVITPLTDRCYRTLIGAYNLHLNGAPEGPAGTGKTETTKDLAKALAKQCIVFNCSEGLDYKSMSRFFKGIAATGAWICFDEFNRINVEVLSVVAQQILCITQAVQQRLNVFNIEGVVLNLNPTCFVSITMNPGYAGRSELPDNLKVLFRTVAMMIPDYAMISEISLYSYGYLHARNLSIKLVTIYRLCSEQLSLQNHYDYGMRAVKSVLLACGTSKVVYPDIDENVLLLQSLRDINFPKFISQDIILFEGIISDVFPNIKTLDVTNENIKSLAIDICKKYGLEASDYFIMKIEQVYQILLIRHGFMLVGEPLSGKSTILKILYEALCVKHNINVQDGMQVINPKSININKLYGYSDELSQEWYDGIVGILFKKFVSDASSKPKWLVFDGPVDAIWIENLNTVLDDSKKLCLTSGETIAMADSMSMVFEVMDLSQASPATVSRCGMIYTESNSFGIYPFIKSWINEDSKWKKEYEKLLEDMCLWLFPKLLKFYEIIEKPLTTGGKINVVVGTLFLINVLMTEAVNVDDDSKNYKSWIQASFIFGIIWGIGGNLLFSSKIKFDKYLKELLKHEESIPLSLEKIDISIPSEGLLYDYIYQYKHKGVWKEWQEMIKNVEILETKNLQEIIVPTIDFIKCSFFLDLHIKYKKPLALIGPTGTGKTLYIKDYIMNKISTEKYTPAFITFTTTTTTDEIQELILAKLYKLKRNKYGPSQNKLAIFFIDDINMPAKEQYGAQPVIELIRQYFDYKYWYDLKSLEILNIINVLILAAMGPVGGSRQLLSPRFMRHYNLFYIDEFSEESMIKIFTNTLQIGLKRNGFGNDIYSYISAIISGTLNIYNSIQKNFLPTVIKPHYMFNIRDFSRVIHGCSLLKKESADNKKIFAKLWIHEILRVFYDRLVNSEDRNWFFTLIIKSVQENFKESIESICENYKNTEDFVSETSINTLMFGTYFDIDSLDEHKKYEEVPNIQMLYERAFSAMEEYNVTNKEKINIVLFQYAIEHLSRICRIFSIPGGSALLVGIGGSGRQSLTKISSIMLGKYLFQPNITKDYDLNKWRDDLKNVLKQSGGLAKETIFLLNENQIIHEAFIQNINNLLNTGEVPALFDLEEQQEILEMVRLDAQGGNRNLDVSVLQVLSFFINRCKTKMHICICLSPVGNSFRDRLRIYPSLTNCCTIDWFDNWPEEALQKVAQHYVKNVNLEDNIKDEIVEMSKYLHVYSYKMSYDYYHISQRQIHITSGSYIDLINLFMTLIKEKQLELSAAKERYINGLEKLEMAAEAVTKMQNELSELKPKLIEMAAKGTEMMKEIEKETIEADKATQLVKEDEKIANEQAAAAQALKKDCEAELATAIPVLEDAIAALNTLKPTDITLVKSMKNPPAVIKLVMAAVCVMKNIPPDRIPDPANPGRMALDYWGPSKRLLGDMAFLQSLKEFDKDNIPPSTMAKIRKEYLNHKDFKPGVIAKASTAAEGLCKWIIAMDMYDTVAKAVAPKKAKLQSAEEEFAATMAILDEKKAMVAKLEKKVADLNSNLENANLKKRLLEEEAQICENKLYRAEKLIGGLGGEKSRWTQAAENLQSQYDNLAGDILLSCGIIAYLSSFPVKNRISAITDWTENIKGMQIPFSDEYSLLKVLGNEVKIQNWYRFSLPRDQVSTDNGIIQDVSLKWSLFVDPQGQACKWIKSMEESNNLEIIKLTDKNYMEKIQNCIEFGKPVLIENITEEIHTSLDPILRRKTYLISSKEYITIGENDIEYNKNFRFYMVSKLRNPHFSPEIFNKVTIINFALSMDGLVDQLLGIVVAKERPDLQEKREQLIIENAENTAALRGLENNILKTLQESKGDILEDEAAIEILDSSKLLSVEIIKRKDAAKETENLINSFRNSYMPIAKHSANLYYSITDLPNLNSVYQFSLAWYINLYIYSIKTANHSKILEKRLKYLSNTFTYNLYCNVCRSLFEKDKLMFSFILCCTILMNTDINTTEFNFLINGGVLIENEKNSIEWLPLKSWNEICTLNGILSFENFKTSFLENNLQWKKIYDSFEPYKESFPHPWNNLSSFQKLILIKIFRPDKLLDTINIFIKTHMGKQFVEYPTFDLSNIFVESNCLVPLIFILSPGTDPITPLMKFSTAKFITLNTLSLGQGQGKIAYEMIREGQENGSWVCLQNCHLCISWLPELENIVESFDLINTSINFRLWLTTYPTDKFPQTLLLNSIKMTNEPPFGFKNNLSRLYKSDPVKDPVFYEGCPMKFEAFSKLIYSVCFFHGVIQERKCFGSLGWNIPYSFDDSDLHISLMQIQTFLNEYEYIPYDALTYLIGECNYGGRITDDWDRRLIVTLLSDFINIDIIKNTNYQFCKFSNKYNLPVRFEYKDYIEHVNKVPEVSSPELFGLNINAGIFRDYSDSMSLIDSLSLLHGQHKKSSIDSDNLINSICLEIIEKIPDMFNIEEAKNKYPIDYNESMNMFLIQEMERYNILNKKIISSLKQILNSIKGYTVMTPDIECEIDYISKGKIPISWIKVSYPSLKSLSDYISDLINRLNVLKTWEDNGKPTVFWISGFFFTQAFLTGGMQNYARKQKCAIDTLTFDCEIIKDDSINKNIENGFYINGFFIEGARWNNTKLILDEQHPKILHEEMPIFKIFIIPKIALKEENRYKCPIYKTTARRGLISTTGHSTNFVISLLIPSEKHHFHWIKRSTAMMLQIPS